MNLLTVLLFGGITCIILGSNLTKHVLTLAYLPHSLDYLYQTLTWVLYSICIQMLLTIPLNCIQQSSFKITKLNQHESFLLQLSSSFTRLSLSNNDIGLVLNSNPNTVVNSSKLYIAINL